MHPSLSLARIHWRQLLAPYIALKDLPVMIGLSLAGSLVAGVYGILHDQLTYTISPEYFTSFKFYQFDYADFGFSERVLTAEIGFLATWWVGFFCVWFLSRRLLPGQPRAHACKQIAAGFAIMGLASIFFGVIGCLYGLAQGPEADYSRWTVMLTRLRIEQPWAFIRVAYIHNASYLGGILGFFAALFAIRPQRLSGLKQAEGG